MIPTFITANTILRLLKGSGASCLKNQSKEESGTYSKR